MDMILIKNLNGGDVFILLKMFHVCRIIANQKMINIHWNVLESCVSINRDSMPVYGPETTLRKVIHELGFTHFTMHTFRLTDDTNVLDVPISSVPPLCYVKVEDIQEKINNIIYDYDGFHNHGIMF